jgi:hypothetical protein
VIRLRPAALVLVAAGLLSGCAGVPTSGPIEQGPAVGVAGEDQFIRVIARPPRPGMTPEEVVRGFQEATASADAGYTVARQYLTDLASSQWSPGAGVSIYSNAGLTLTQKDSVIAAEGVLSGTIDATGQYSVAAPGETLATSYGLDEVDGEWRISSAPRGLVLAPGDIDRGFRSFDLYYFTRDFSTLVPAPVTVPLSDAGLATQLVRGLLAGPTTWLAPAVATAFPEGTRLALDSVPVVDGVAEVALTTEVLKADDSTRQALSAQIVWTLRQLPDITGVRMTVSGQPVAVPGASVTQPMDSWSTYDPDVLPDNAVAYALDPRGLVSVDLDGKVALVAQLKPAVVLPGVSLDSQRLAGVAPDRRSLWEYRVGSAQAGVRRYTGTDLSRPSWDRSGGVWVADRGTGLVLVRGGTATAVPVVGLPEGVTDADVIAVAVARDGTRIAILVRRGPRVEPMVARVERTGDQVRVSAPRRVEAVVTAALDIAWQDADTLMVLGTSGASSLEVLQFGVGSSRVRSTSAPEGAATLAAGPGRVTLLGSQDSLFRNTGSSWARLVDGTDPTYPG